MLQQPGLLFNEDDTDFFYCHEIKEGVDAAAVLGQYLDLMADAGVTVFLCCTNARKTNYRSNVWEAYWDGYDPDGPLDQPYLRPIPADQRPTWRRLIHSMWAVNAQGVDYPAAVISGCRQRGISPWLTLRMNDVHENDKLDHPFHGAIFREAKYHRGGTGYYARGLDYAHAEVRDYYRALVVETLQRYDLDGLELDFMREPYLFAPGAEAAGEPILHDWMRGIKRLVHDASVRRGHPILLGVRVPSHVEVARSWGLDAVKWAREGLVDLVVPTPRWATLEFDMPLDEWRRELAGTGVALAGGLEVRCQPWPGAEAHGCNPARAAGAAAAVLSAGADAAYLFNYFGCTIGGNGWTRETYCQTFQAMRSLDTLAKLPRRHVVTWRDIIGAGEQYRAPLPATGLNLSFQLPTGPAPGPQAKVALELTVNVPAGTTVTPPAAQVNGTDCAFQSRQDLPDHTALLTYTVPPTALPGNSRDTITVKAADAQAVRVDGVEVSVVP